MIEERVLELKKILSANFSESGKAPARDFFKMSHCAHTMDRRTAERRKRFFAFVRWLPRLFSVLFTSLAHT